MDMRKHQSNLWATVRKSLGPDMTPRAQKITIVLGIVACILEAYVVLAALPNLMPGDQGADVVSSFRDSWGFVVASIMFAGMFAHALWPRS